MNNQPNSLRSALEAAFPVESHSVRIMRKSSKGSAQLLVYIQARDVMDRLDDVFGTGSWSDSYTVIHLVDRGQDGKGVQQFTCAVECKLTVRPNAQMMTDAMVVADVGTGDGADAIKGAYSDALKRAAVKLGIGRYLYGLKLETWYPTDDYGLTKAGYEQAMRDIGRKLGYSTAVPAPDHDVDYGHGDHPAQAVRVQPVAVVPVRLAPEQVKVTRQLADDETADMWDTPSQGGEPMGFSDSTVALLSRWQEMAESDSDEASVAQVKLLTGLLDGATQVGAAGTVMSALIGDGQAVGKRLAKDLLDGLLKRTKDKEGNWGDNPAYNPTYGAALAEIYATVSA